MIYFDFIASRFFFFFFKDSWVLHSLSSFRFEMSAFSLSTEMASCVVIIFSVTLYSAIFFLAGVLFLP